MSTSTLERPPVNTTVEFGTDADPTVLPQLSAGGNAGQPPEIKLTAIAAPDPSEGAGKFNPDRAETDKTFHEMVAANLGDVATTGTEIAKEHENSQN